jgi:hypothetical protein
LKSTDINTATANQKIPMVITRNSSIVSTPESATIGNHWAAYPASWDRVKPPLRVNQAIVQSFRTALSQAHPGHVLMLGMTPELVPLFNDLDVVDRNPAMLQSLWLGNDQRRQAYAMDWLVFAGNNIPYQVVVGDGSLNNADSPENLRAIIHHAHQMLAPGGWLACRLFERPEKPFTLEDLRAVTGGRAGVNFHAFKWMMAMYLADQLGMAVPVCRIHALFSALSSDIAQLSKQTGWPLEEIRTIDIYAGSTVSYVFPNRREWLNMLPPGVEPHFLPTGQYDLSDRCPLLVYQKTR